MSTIEYEGKIWVRKGECNNCGKCCIGRVSSIVCKKLDVETMTCTIYEDRPDYCKGYPYTPEHLFKGCGFWFETLDGSEILKDVVDVGDMD